MMIYHFKNKPYRPIWTSIILILGLSIIDPNSAIDIQLHDTYLVIGLMQIGVFFSLLLGLIGGIYWLLRKKKLIGWMTALHVILTIVTLLLIILIGLIFGNNSQTNFEVFKRINHGIFFLIVLMLVSQLIFLGNLIISLLQSSLKEKYNKDGINYRK